MRSISVKLAGSKLPRDTRITAVPGIEVVTLTPPVCCSLRSNRLSERNEARGRPRSRPAILRRDSPLTRRQVQELMRQRRADAADTETRARPAGRPRNPAVDVAILAAAERQLGERGYAGMSLESVAAAAGTTAPSLRRRYQTKLELATAVIDSLRVQPLPKPTGTPRVDAAEILANFQSNLLRLHGMATVGTILAEEQRNPELLAHFRQHLVGPRRAALHRTLAAGVKTGERALSIVRGYLNFRMPVASNMQFSLISRRKI